MTGFEAECPPAEDRIWRHPSEVRMSGTSRPRRSWRILRPGRGRLSARHVEHLPETAGVPLAPEAWMLSGYGCLQPSFSIDRRGTPDRGPLRAPAVAVVVLATVVTSAAVLVGFHLAEPAPSAHPQSSYLAGAPSNLSLTSQGAGGHAAKGPVLAKISSVEAGPSVLETMSALRAASVRITSVRKDAVTRGAGLVMRPSGLIITTSQLVAGAKHITIVTPTGQRRRAVLVGSDSSSDIAVIRAIGTRVRLHALPAMASTETPAHVGELTIAMAPAATGGVAVALGVVRSAGHHALIAPGTALINSIRTDAPLGAEAQGGALINGAGQLIGVIASSGSTSPGRLTTSIPAQLAFGVANELATKGRVVHGWLGIEAADATPDTAGSAETSLGNAAAPLGAPDGARVTAVEPSSSAQQAGIRPGDVIAMLNGQTVSSMAELKSDLYLMPPYTRVIIGVVRSGQSAPLMLNAVLGPSPTRAA